MAVSSVGTVTVIATNHPQSEMRQRPSATTIEACIFKLVTSGCLSESDVAYSILRVLLAIIIDC